MAARGLLHPPSSIAGPRPLLRRSCLPSSHRAYAFRCRFSSTPSPFSVKSVMADDRAGALVQARVSPQALLEASDTEAVEFVNQEPPGPMVEVDPVTVFRRIIAERRASFAMARAKQQAEDATAMQLAGGHPFSIGGRWSGKSAIAIALAMVLLLLAALAFFARSRRGTDKQEELISVEEDDRTDGSAINGGNKLVDDNIQAPESILTAMTIGAASVGRLKGQTGSSYDTVNGTNGNVIGTQRLNTTEPTTIAEDMNAEGHGALSSDKISYNTSSMEPMGAFNAQDVGVDVAEGPWFGQAAADDAESLDSGIEAASALPDPVSNEVLATDALNKISEGDVMYATPPLTDLVDGEFLGEVVSASVVTEEALGDDSSPQTGSFQYEEFEDDGVLEENSALLEKLEQAIQLVEEIHESEHDGVSEGHMTLMETDTNGDNAFPGVAGYERDEDREAAHPFISSEVEKVASMDAIEGENKHAGSLDGRVASADSFDPLAASLLHGEQQTYDSMLMTHQDSDALIHTSMADMASDSSDPSSREINEKALEAAVPALSVGVGTIGTLLGAAGGLQVVGFAALASFISRNFFWAESRAELWNELKAITDRQKLQNFLAKRNILRTDEEEASL